MFNHSEITNTLKAEGHLHNLHNMQSLPQRKRRGSMTTINWLMLFEEIKAVHSENHKKPTKYTRQNAELLLLKQVVHIVTTRLQKSNIRGR
jgi:hypothetical protein